MLIVYEAVVLQHSNHCISISFVLILNEHTQSFQCVLLMVFVLLPNPKNGNHPDAHFRTNHRISLFVPIALSYMEYDL